MKNRDICIIGYGNWGASLAQALVSAELPLREIVVRQKPRKPMTQGPALPFVPWREAKLDAAILWLCVPDGAVADTAARIVAKRGRLKGQVVIHSSGALTAAALEPARVAGAVVGSVHPVMTFPTREPVPLRGVLFGIEATPSLQRTLATLVRRLGGKPFGIESGRKALYHAAGTLSSPLIVSALAAAMETAALAGVAQPAAFVQALAQATVANVFAHGPENSFSGPFARGDVETIELHLRALARHPMLHGLYRSLGLYATKALPVARRHSLQTVLKRMRN